jgi:hypothetical protein
MTDDIIITNPTDDLVVSQADESVVVVMETVGINDAIVATAAAATAVAVAEQLEDFVGVTPANTFYAGPTSGIDALAAFRVTVNADMPDMAESTIKGRAAGAGSGDQTDLTGTQATAILDAFTGDSGSGGVKGVVPAPAAGDATMGKVVSADGSWRHRSGLSSRTESILDRLTTRVSRDEQLLIDKFIVAVESFLASNMGCFYWFGAETEQLAKIDFANPTSLTRIATPSGSVVPVHTPGIGYTGNAAQSATVLLGYDPATHGGPYTQNSGFFGAGCLNEVSNVSKRYQVDLSSILEGDPTRIPCNKVWTGRPKLRFNHLTQASATKLYVTDTNICDWDLPGINRAGTVTLIGMNHPRSGPNGTSNTNLYIDPDIGTVTFVTQASQAWFVGDRVRATADSGDVYLEGLVTAYAGTDLEIAVDDVMCGYGRGLGIVDYNGYSETSLSVGTGAKVFTTEEHKVWVAGDRVRATGNSGSSYMEGEVTSYTGSTLTVDVDATSGAAGPWTDWEISPRGISGDPIRFLSTSTTSLTIAAASKVFTLAGAANAESWVVGHRVRATGNAGASYMEGDVTAYSGTTLTVLMDATSGAAGPWTDWELTRRHSTWAITTRQTTDSVHMGTSTTSITPSVASKVFTTQADKSWTAGDFVRIQGNEDASFMEGTVTTYVGTTLTVDVTDISGSVAGAPYTDWNIRTILSLDYDVSAVTPVETTTLSDVATHTIEKYLDVTVSNTADSGGSKPFADGDDIRMVYEPTTSGGALICTSNSVASLGLRNNSNQITLQSNSTSGTIVSNIFSSAQNFHINRSASTGYAYFIDGRLKSSVVRTSSASALTEFRVFGRTALFSDAICPWAAVGGDMSHDQTCEFVGHIMGILLAERGLL